MNKTSLLAALLLAAGSLTVRANLLTGLYNTGVDNTGAVTTGLDSHYTITSPGGDVAVIGNIAWGSLGNDGLSQWDSPYLGSPSGSPDQSAGVYKYQTTFNVSGPFTSASITGQFATDNELYNIVLNGHLLGIQQLNAVGFASFTSFSITTTADFVSGVNTLEFDVNNDSGPTGFRVEMTGNAINAPGVPDSTPTGGLLLTALGCLGWVFGGYGCAGQRAGGAA